MQLHAERQARAERALQHLHGEVRLIQRSVDAGRAESHPDQYAGVMPVCGFLAGGQAFVDYISNVRLLFNIYYPGVLPGEPLGSPPLPVGTMLRLAQTAMKADPSGALPIASAMDTIGMPLPAVPGQPATLIGSIVTALAYLLSGSESLVTLTHGHVPFDNLSTDYVIPDVQAAMPRYQGHPAAMNYMQRAYQPTGRLRIPMLAVENAFDPVAAGFHRDRYARLLGETGALGLFARVTLPTFGHCPDTAEPTVSAFQQLVAWVETGVRP